MADRALVTGATGFVGANLTRSLLDDGYEVHVLVRPDRRPWRLAGIEHDLVWHEASLEDGDSVGEAISGIRPRFVFHLGVYGAYPDQTDVDRMARTNLQGTMAVLDASVASGAEVVVNTGSSSEYGPKGHPASEEESLEPTSPYGVTKAAGTMYARYLAARHEAWIPTLRLYSVYGPYEEPTRLWPRLLLSALSGDLPVLADPRTARDFVHVDDVVRAYMTITQTRHEDHGRVYNVASGRQSTLSELVSAVMDEIGVEVPPKWGSMPDRDWDSDTWVGDIGRIVSETAWTPICGLREGIRSFADWFRARPEMVEHYRRDGFGSSLGGDGRFRPGA